MDKLQEWLDRIETWVAENKDFLTSPTFIVGGLILFLIVIALFGGSSDSANWSDLQQNRQ